MYCPECRVVYREGFTECVDCRAPLRAGAPPPVQARPADSSDSSDELVMDDLVVVLESGEPVQLAMAKGLLEDAGIPFFVGSALFPGTGYSARGLDGGQGWGLGLAGWTVVQVARDREAEARELLAPLLEPVDDFSPEQPETGETR